MKACATGKHFAKGVLVVRKAGDNPLEYLKITMKHSCYQRVDWRGAGRRLPRTSPLNFAKVKFEYTPQTDKGGAGSSEV